MAIFMLETDAVSSGATSLTSIASQITSIGSAVSGYDTTCEDLLKQLSLVILKLVQQK